MYTVARVTVAVSGRGRKISFSVGLAEGEDLQVEISRLVSMGLVLERLRPSEIFGCDSAPGVRS